MSFWSPICATVYPEIIKSVNESIKKEQEWLDRKPKWWQFKQRKIWLSEKPVGRVYHV